MVIPAVTMRRQCEESPRVLVVSVILHHFLMILVKEMKGFFDDISERL